MGSAHSSIALEQFVGNSRHKISLVKISITPIGYPSLNYSEKKESKELDTLLFGHYTKVTL